MIIRLADLNPEEAPHEVFCTITLKGSDNPNLKRNLHCKWTATNKAKRLRFSATVTTGPSSLDYSTMTAEQKIQADMHKGARVGIDFFDASDRILETSSKYVEMASADELDHLVDVPENAIGFIAWFQVYRGIGNNEKGTAFFEDPQIAFIYDSGDVAQIMP